MTQAEIAAKYIITKFGTNNPFEIASSLGISVIYTSLSGMRGFYQQDIYGDIIYIEESLCPEFQMFICAHELGHALMDSSMNAVYLSNHTFHNLSKHERNADRFAVMLLWPDDSELMKYADLTLEQLSNLMGVPEELIKWRYNQIEM